MTKLECYDFISFLELIEGMEYKCDSKFFSRLLKNLKMLDFEDILQYKPFKDKDLNFELHDSMMKFLNSLGGIEQKYLISKEGLKGSTD